MTEAILLFGDSRNPTLIWRTGFLAPDPVVYLEDDGKGTLLVNSMELGRARKEARVDTVRSYDEFGFGARYREGGERHAFAGMVGALLAETGVARVRVQPDFPVALARAIEAGDVEVVADKPLFETERRQKREDEQAAIQQTQAAAQAGLTVARELLKHAEVRDGMLYHEGEPLSSTVVKQAIEVELLRHGCATPEGTIVAGGAAAADPHTSDTGHLAAGEPVIVDIFPRTRGRSTSATSPAPSSPASPAPSGCGCTTPSRPRRPRRSLRSGPAATVARPTWPSAVPSMTRASPPWSRASSARASRP